MLSEDARKNKILKLEKARVDELLKTINIIEGVTEHEELKDKITSENDIRALDDMGLDKETLQEEPVIKPKPIEKKTKKTSYKRKKIQKSKK